MDSLSLTMGLAHIGTSLVVIGLSMPLLKNRIPRNGWYGFRTPTTLSSDEAWYASNSYCARKMIPCSAAIMLFGVVCLFIPMLEHESLAVVTGLASLGYLVPVFQAWRFSRQFRPRAE